MWSKLPEAQKAAYQNRAAKSREKYQKELAEYNASKKAAAKADAAAPAAEAAPKKRKKSKSEDGGKIYAIAARFTCVLPHSEKRARRRTRTRREAVRV